MNWRAHIDEPKTEKSRAPVPVIAPLAELLARLLAESDSQSLWIFAAGNGNPLHLDNLTRRVICPVLKLAGIRWRGWHAFRRGLATNLNRLGVSAKVIQAILRHSQISTTMDIYVKPVEADVVEGMQKLEAIVQRAGFCATASDRLN